MDHERLLAAHPRLVYASLTGYGLDGPDKDAPGYDLAAFSARAGVIDRTTPAGATLTVSTVTALIRFYPSATGGFFLLGGLGVGRT